jgi:hypothetical protein
MFKENISKKIMLTSLFLTIMVLTFTACSKKVISTKGAVSKSASSAISAQFTSSEEASSNPASSKSEEVIIPDMVGGDKKTATSLITALGLVPNIKDISVMSDGSSKSPKYKVGTISSIDPKAGSSVKIGSTVTCNSVSSVNYYHPYYSPGSMNLENNFTQLSYWCPISIDLNPNGILTLKYTIKLYGERTNEHYKFMSASLNGIKGTITSDAIYNGTEYPVTMTFHIGNSKPTTAKIILSIGGTANCPTYIILDPSDFTIKIDWI